MSYDNHIERIHDIYEAAGLAVDALYGAIRREPTPEGKALLSREQRRLLDMLERIAERYTMPVLNPFTGHRERLAPWSSREASQ
jgi:hypothetical protein